MREIYGDPEVHPQSENYPGNVDPIGERAVYDEAKRFAESVTMAYHRFHGVNTSIVRIFNTYGPRMDLEDAETRLADAEQMPRLGVGQFLGAPAHDGGQVLLLQGPADPVAVETAALVIGDRVTVGHKAVLHGCEIGDECLVGMGAVVMDRVVVESHVIIGAGSLVPPGKVLQSGFLYTGSPVRQARPLTDKERGYFAYSADYYVELARRHRAALTD